MKSSAKLATNLAERLLIGALHEQDAAAAAEATADRARWLARISHELAMSLDEAATRDAVRRVTLPRPGTWCIVDVLEPDGSIRRLPVIHPDPAKQDLALGLEQLWPPGGAALRIPPDIIPETTVLTHLSGAVLLRAAHGKENLAILKRIGFGHLLVVPLVVRARVQGALMFVGPAGDPVFTPEEIALAVDLAARCALALDNARLYREADALRVAAQAANKSKSEFLGGMSHELRTPLNAIGGFTELMRMGIQGPVTPEQEHSLDRIKANQAHLLALITEILNFARLETGRVEYQCAKVELPGALAAVADMLAVAMRSTGLTVDGPNADPDVVAWADPDRVRQILMNLVMNAIKYGASKSGTITLRCGQAGDTVTASVADTGAGIPPEKLDTIFQPFVQLEAGLTERRGGVGLGLAISRDLARGMHGDLEVESVVGNGARFTLTLPRATQRQRRTAPTVVTAPGS
ncbi:MAG: GAF domain-containing sensor histidine kinase [Gemmatimonadaceae bacterium]